MDMNLVEQIDAFRWKPSVKHRGRALPVVFFGSEALIRDMDNDVDLVADVSEKAALADRLALLRPKACVKG